MRVAAALATANDRATVCREPKHCAAAEKACYVIAEEAAKSVLRVNSFNAWLGDNCTVPANAVAR